MLDFGGSRTIGAFFGGSRTIGAFLDVRFDIDIFRLDSIPETPFHAARFRARNRSAYRAFDTSKRKEFSHGHDLDEIRQGQRGANP
jgi:hypothetical protein